MVAPREAELAGVGEKGGGVLSARAGEVAPSIGARGRRTSWQAKWWCLGEVDSAREGDGGRRRRAATPAVVLAPGRGAWCRAKWPVARGK